MTATTQNDANLLTRALQGDGRAFRALVEPHLRMLHRVAMRVCRNPQLAEDAVQETLVICFQRLDNLDEKSNLKAFMASTVAKRAHTLQRSEWRRKHRQDATAEPQNLPGPSDDLHASRLADRIRDVLLAMPEKRREAALMRLDANLSYRQIAEAIGSTEGSTRVLVHQALTELREQLGDWLTPGSKP